MNLKGEIITLENNYDYLVYDFLNFNDNDYYMLFKLEDEEVTDELLILKGLDKESLQIINNDEEFDLIKSKFWQNNLNNEHHVPSVHIKANYGEIAPLVIMPGDPLRAKYIAEKFLTNAVLVSDVRGILAYTGTYNGVKVSVMAAGMGMPSAGIYYHELFKFYDVSKIIRIGTCGGTIKEEKLLDLVIANKSYTNSNFAKTYSSNDVHLSYPSYELTKKMEEYCNNNQVHYHNGGVFTMDFFGPYINVDNLYKELPSDFDLMAEEMECFGLFHIASILNKEAACILTVVDTPFYDTIISSEQREAGLDEMIKVALEAITSK